MEPQSTYLVVTAVRFAIVAVGLAIWLVPPAGASLAPRRDLQ
jgi:hypothetical protein